MVLQPEEAGRATSVSADEAGRGRQIRLAAVASVVGTSIEWYDFFLYGTAAAIVFPAVFFPSFKLLRGHSGIVRHLRRRVRGPAGRGGDLRSLG